MTNKTITISNIVFEKNQLTVQVPKELLRDKLATETYVRTWLFDNLALNYKVVASEQSIILEKNEQQPFDLDLVDDTSYVDYQSVNVVLKQQTDYRCVVTDDMIDLFDGISLTAFYKLQSELPIELHIQ